jgi:aspartate 1-decarboxylase
MNSPIEKSRSLALKGEEHSLEAKKFKPTVVLVDEKNRIKKILDSSGGHEL